MGLVPKDLQINHPSGLKKLIQQSQLYKNKIRYPVLKKVNVTHLLVSAPAILDSSEQTVPKSTSASKSTVWTMEPVLMELALVLMAGTGQLAQLMNQATIRAMN